MADFTSDYIKRYTTGDGDSPVSEIARSVARNTGVNALSGIRGLSELPNGPDAAADAVRKYQSEFGNYDLSPAGQDTIRNYIAPAMEKIKGAARLMGKYMPTPLMQLAQAYHPAVDAAASAAGHIDPRLAGVVGAAGEIAPNLPLPEAGAAVKTGERALEEAQMLSHNVPQDLRVLDNATPGAIEREGAAARRGNGIALSSNKATDVGHPQAGLIGYHPDAMVFDAHTPEGEHVGRLIAEPGDGMLQGRTADIFDENNRGHGWGTQMLKHGVDHAHTNDLDWGSDVKLSPGQVATYMKLQEHGYPMEFNPTASIADDSYLTSGDGKPVLTIPKPTHPDTATPDETPTFGAKNYVQSQAGDQQPAPLNGLPRQVHAGGVPISVGPNPVIRQVAQQYMDDHGITRPQQTNYVKLDKDRAKQVADAYDSMPHAPNDPKVAASYEAMINETKAQYQYIKRAGLQPEFIPEGHPDPYAASPRLATEDINQNNHFWVFPTSSGFGTLEPAATDNPLLRDSGEQFNGVPATNNDLFRVVHDYFGHAKEGVGFRAEGEENAWQQHAGMYSDQARPAMTSETRGQNSWVNSGPYAKQNATASGADTVYAPQKVGLLPDEFTDPLNESSGGSTDGSGPGGYRGGGVVRRADGGEAGALLDPVMGLISKYAGTANQTEHAGLLAGQVADEGKATYNPTTGDVHSTGYAVPTEPSRSVALDHAPDSSEIHDFLMSNQDAFEADPKAAMHIESDGDNHFIHVAHLEPDFQSAMAAAQAFDAPGIREIHTGTNFPRQPGESSARIGATAAETGSEPHEELPQDEAEAYLSGAKTKKTAGPVVGDLPAELDTDRNARPPVSWSHGSPTVAGHKRVAFPGIYNDPRTVIADSNRMVGQEDPLLQQLFGVSRQDLSDIAQSRQGNELGVLPGAKPTATGAAAARSVMTPENEQRLIDVLTEARGTPLHTGMTGWYSMDPLYERFRQIFGEDDAPAKYAKFNALMGMASPGSDVGTEIARGTSAHWLDTQNRFQDFAKYAGIANTDRAGMPDFPPDMLGVPGHAYHPTAQAGPMAQYLNSGSLQMKSPKVPMYIGASGVPEIGHQSDIPVGDAHWARGVGLADTRDWRYKKGQQVVPGSSVSTPEMQVLGPWWRDRVAAQAGYQSVPAQATAWGAFAPYTGVESAIGAPKLEILSTKIGQLATRLGISPESARDLVITGKAGAYKLGGLVSVRR